MGDMGLGWAGGAAGAADALQTLFQQRMQAGAAQRDQQRIDQQDALTRIKLAEQADNIRMHGEAMKSAEATRAQAAQFHADDLGERATERQFTMTPAGAEMQPALGAKAEAAGFPVTRIAGPKVQQTTGFMPLPSAPPQGPGMQAMGDLTPASRGPQPMGDLTPIDRGPQIAAGTSTTSADASSPLNAPSRFTRGATQADLAKADDEQRRREADQLRADAAAARGEALDAYRQSNLSLRERDVSRREDQYTNRLNPPDDPTLPRGVQDYALQLRQRYGSDLQGAEKELATAWPDVKRAHPNVDATKAVAALRSMFGAQAGASKTEELLRSFLPAGAGVSPLPVIQGLTPLNGRGAPQASAGPRPPTGPQMGEQRLINGQLGVWDGRGWKSAGQ